MVDLEEPPPLGRPTVPADVRALIRTMAQANPRWGAPRIHGELLKLGIDVCQATVAKYMMRQRQPPSQTWRTFLRNHIGQIVAADFFVVPTVDAERAVHRAGTTRATTSASATGEGSTPHMAFRLRRRMS